MFIRCYALEEIEIPNTVTEIGNETFQDCTKLKEIVIPDAVTTIGKYAFMDCPVLATVSLGKGLQQLKEDAFKGCTAITSVTCLATTPPTMGSSMCFETSTYSSAMLSVPEASIEAYSSANWWKNFSTIESSLYDFCYNGLYYKKFDYSYVKVTARDKNYNTYSGDITIPYSVQSSRVKEIDAKAFYNCSGLTSVSIPDGVEAIGDSAFADCPALDSIRCTAETPPEVASINSFLGLYSRTKVYVTGEIDYKNAYAWKSFTRLYGDYSFKADDICYRVNGNNASVTRRYANDYMPSIYRDDVIIPGTVTYLGATYTVTGIGAKAFYNSFYLKSVDMPNTITYIGESAFFVSAVEKLVIPNSVTTIGPYAFYHCANLSSLILGESLESIGDYALYNNDKLESLVIPNSVRTIGQFAFESCVGLKYLVLGNSLTYIGQCAFYNCPLRAIVSLVVTPPSLGYYVFHNSHNSATLYVPIASESLYKSFNAGEWKEFTNIVGLFDFENNGICYAKTGTSTATAVYGFRILDGELSIPRAVVDNGTTYRVTAIGDDAFASIDGITSVTIPSTVKTIGETAFYACPNLQSVEIGSGVTSIGSLAFADCPMLTDVTCLATTPPTMADSDCFDPSYDTATLHVPNASLNAYKTANWWKLFSSIVGLDTFARGDVNGDENVNIADVTALIDYLLSGNAAGVNVGAADCNQDETVNIADVTALIDYLLSGHW